MIDISKETEEEKRQRQAREAKEQQAWLRQMSKKTLEKPIDELDDFQVVRFLEDNERLKEVVQKSREEKTVRAAMEKLCRKDEEAGINAIRETLPGECTFEILQFLAKKDGYGVYWYLVKEKLANKIVPILQEKFAGTSVEDVLDSVYQRKYGHLVNFEPGAEPIDYYQMLGQLNDSEDPWNAFKNIDPYFYDRQNMLDASDEFSYLSTKDDTLDVYEFAGYTFHQWRMHLLKEADLHLEDEEG